MLLNLYGTFLAALLITNRTHALHIVRTKPLLWFTLERERERSASPKLILHDIACDLCTITHWARAQLRNCRAVGSGVDAGGGTNTTTSHRLMCVSLIVYWSRACAVQTRTRNWNGYSYPLHNAVNLNRCEVHSGSHYSLGLCARTHTHSHTRTCVIM